MNLICETLVYAKKNYYLCTVLRRTEARTVIRIHERDKIFCDRLHIGHHQIYEWLYVYKEKGVSGLENKRICKKNQYSFEKKCEIIREYQESELTLQEISSKHGISASTLVGWLSKFNKDGKDALASKQPSPREHSKSIMKRLPKDLSPVLVKRRKFAQTSNISSRNRQRLK